MSLLVLFFLFVSLFCLSNCVVCIVTVHFACTMHFIIIKVVFFNFLLAVSVWETVICELPGWQADNQQMKTPGNQMYIILKGIICFRHFAHTQVIKTIQQYYITVKQTNLIWGFPEHCESFLIHMSNMCNHHNHLMFGCWLSVCATTQQLWHIYTHLN